MYSIEKPPGRPGQEDLPLQRFKKKVGTRKPQVVFPSLGSKMQGFPRDESILVPKEAFAKYFSFLRNVQLKEFVCIKKPLVRTSPSTQPVPKEAG